MFRAKIIADSITVDGERLTTVEATYPRIIHSEIMTHRDFSRNAASSRAIPTEKMVASVREAPALFEQYGKANKGMSHQGLMDAADREEFIADWIALGRTVSNFSEKWKDRAAKQIANRPMEPWMHMTTVLSATEWINFFALRADAAAQPEFQRLAYMILDRYLKSTPVRRHSSKTVEIQMPWIEKRWQIVPPQEAWHLPYITDEERAAFDLPSLILTSTARLARTSYTKQAVVKVLEDDQRVYDRLVGSFPKHMSPAEHPAWANPGHRSGNFRGWFQHRKQITAETVVELDLAKILEGRPEWVRLGDD